MAPDEAPSPGTAADLGVKQIVEVAAQKGYWKSPRGQDAARHGLLGDPVLRVAQFDKLVEDAADDGDLGRLAFHERHPLVLDGLIVGATTSA